MYQIEYLSDLHTLEITITGFFTEALAGAFARDLAIAVKAQSVLTPPASLYNYTAAGIQSQPVIAMFQAIARGVKPGRRVAMYTEGQLARMQARRIAAECPTMHLFDDRAAAVAWLRATALGIAA